jgi:hypothetical protein
MRPFNQVILKIQLLLLTPIGVVAQINYTDVVPDSTVQATIMTQLASFYIDLDHDGTVDFELRHFNPGVGNEAVELHGEVIGTREVLVDSSDHARVISEGDTIDPNATQWGNDMYGVLNAAWYGPGDKYFGFRFIKAGQWHYAWVRVTIPTDHLSFTIKDYAYHSLPNTLLLAGEGSNTTGLNKQQLRNENDVRIHPNPFHSLATLQHSFSLHNATLQLFNCQGENVKTIQHIAANKVLLDRKGLDAGVYFYLISEEGRKITAGRMVIAD